MNSYGGKTKPLCTKEKTRFESSVNSYGGKTDGSPLRQKDKFESSVNSYGGKTLFVILNPVQ